MVYNDGMTTHTNSETRRALYECRDIGYGVETGEVFLPALGSADWTGKRCYQSTNLTAVYLFDDEIEGA